MKLCKDCVNTIDGCWCEISYPSPNDGSSMKISIFRARESDIYCGPDGKWFVPKDAPKPIPVPEGFEEVHDLTEIDVGWQYYGYANATWIEIKDQNEAIEIFKKARIYNMPVCRPVKPEPGEGFRLLGKDEVRRSTDEFIDGNGIWDRPYGSLVLKSGGGTWRRTTRPAKCRLCGSEPLISKFFSPDFENKYRCKCPGCDCSGSKKPTEVESVDAWNQLHLEG